ncbi:MAG: amino acid adenylation domain-containing protein [Colwellia sp.]|nr:amino acid adenylation domain-containing protein [Colwellia sp.]
MKETRLFLAILNHKGVRLYLDQGKLKSQSPKDGINKDERAYIKENKQLIIQYLETLSRNNAKSLGKSIVRQNSNKGLLSFSQQRLWFIDSLQGGSAEYNMPVAFEVAGQLNLALVTDIFNTILERHEVLRTLYVEDNGETLQHIRSMSDVAFDIKVEDLSHLVDETLERQVRHLVEIDITSPFNLATDLMLRVSYVKKTTETGVMIFNMHHIASDGWSMEVLIKEFFALYGAFSQGQTNPFPELEIQYADYAHWQREYLKGEVLESQLSYWEKQLDELPAVHSLPLDHARPEIKKHEGAVITGELPATIARQLLAVAKQHQLTPFMLLHGALSLLLSRHSNTADIVIGTPVANRLQAELEPLIGFFVNTLVLRADTNHDSLSDYFAHIRQVHLDAQSNQDVPFEQLVERLKAPRSTAHSPLFQIMMATNTDFGLNDGSEMALFTLPDVDIQPYQSDLIQAKFDLSVDLNISEQGVGLNWNYDTSLFTEQHIVQLNKHLCRLLEGLSQTQGRSTQAPYALPMLSAGEVQHLVHELNDSATVYPKDKCIHELFEQQAQDNPENVAVVFEDKQLTYKQLNQKANQLAHYLKAHHDITPDTLVGLCVDRSLEMVIGILAILKAGGAYVPLDPSYPQARLSYMLEDAGLDVVLNQRHVQSVLADFKGSIHVLDGLSHTENHFCAEYANNNLKVTGLTSTSLAYVIYTSGSTGQPKGVMIEHAALVNYQEHIKVAYGLTRADNFLQFSNISFDIFIEEFFGALCQGGQLTLRDEACKTGMKEFVSFCNQFEVTVVSLPTAFWAQLVSTKEKLASTLLRVVIVGGEALSISTVQHHYQLFSTDVALINSYGPTEATVTATSYMTSSADGLSKVVPIGKANINNQLFVMDQDNGLCPLSCIGELYIGGKGLARGYLNRPELTSIIFIDNPFYDESKPNSSPRLYKTGDLVRYLPDGNLAFIGRADDQVKIRGFRIELGEVEAQFTQLETVDSALVMAKVFAGSQQLVGYVKPRDALVETELADYVAVAKALLAQQLPEYMIPGIIMLVDEWPLTPNGKVDRKALPMPDGSALQSEYIAPVTETEQVLVDVWAGLLNIEAKSISTTANFFELGGHSLLSIRLVSDIRTRCGVEISVQSIFNNATLQALARVIEQGSQTVVRPPLLAVKRESDKVPVSFAQQRLWFIDSLQGGSPEYNMPMAFEIEGQLNTTLLTDVFHTILERHEVLRTVYVEEDGETLQYIRNISDIVFEIKIEELSHLTGETLNKQLETMFETDITTPFDLASDLMLRVSYVKKTTDTGVMIFNMHHIASDGWSMEVLIKEFFTLYHAYSQGQVNPLPDLEIQYADYAHWQREYLEGEVLESQLGYWEKQLDELPALHSLPLDHTRPAMKQHEGAIVTGELPATTAKQLLAVAKEHKLTPFMLLHGALSLLLSRHSNSADIVIGTPVANRLQAELEPLIGFFVNTLVLRADTNHDSLSDYFTHIRQIHLDAQSNQDVPFEQLVERLKAPRSTAHSPLFQIMMTTDTDYGLNDESDIASFTLPGVDIQPYESDLNQAKFDIEIDLSISEQGVGLHWTFDVSLFTEQHITRLNDHLCRLLEGLSQTQGQPSQAPHDLPLLSTEEIEHLVHDLNDTAMDYPKDKCIHSLFEQQAEDNPDNVAVVFEDTQLTYKQLNEKANQLAHYLKEHYEIKPDTLVGLCVERSLDMVIGLMGILKAGGAYVPLDPSYPQERLSYMLADAALDVVLSQTQVQTVLAGFKGTILTLDELAGTDNHFCSEYPDSNLTAAEIGLKSSNLAYVIYTSGSTGQPKGVMVEHDSLVNYQEHVKTAYELTQADNFLQFSNTSFDIFIEEFFGALCQGAKLTLRDEACQFGLKEFIDFCNQYEVTVVSLPTAFWAQLISSKEKLASTLLRIVIVGGEALSTSTVQHHYQLFRTGVALINSYGPTEATVTATTYVTSASDGLSKVVPIGKPNINNQLFIIDQYNALCPLNCVGELYIGGEGLARGYLNKPELTSEIFINNPFYDASKPNSSVRLYRTGDLVRYLPEGNLEFLGRADDQVKIRGFRIELGEVEVQLAQLDVVDSALLMARELAGSQQLVGYVKPKDVVAESDIAGYVTAMKSMLGQHLPEYMIPSIIMVVEAWPLTPNGKVDRKALPVPDGSAMQSEYVAAETESEQLLVDIWAGLLNIAPESISTTANFFELGGHSLMIIRQLSRIKQEFGLTLEIQGMYEIANIQELAKLCDSLIIKMQLKDRLTQHADSELEEVEF